MNSQLKNNKLNREELKQTNIKKEISIKNMKNEIEVKSFCFCYENFLIAIKETKEKKWAFLVF